MASTLPQPNDCCNCSDGTAITSTTLDNYITTTVTGSLVGQYVVDTLAALRALTTASTNKSAEVWGRNTVDDGLYSFWRWDNTGTDADDGNNYIRPDDYTSAGVWVRSS